MVASSAMIVLLQLGLQAAKQFGMNAGIDLLAQDLLGPLDSQRGHLLAQGFAGLDGLLLGFNLGGSNDLVALFGRLGFGFFDDTLGTTLGIGQTGGGFVARLGEFVFHALVGAGKLGLGLVGSR